MLNSQEIKWISHRHDHDMDEVSELSFALFLYDVLEEHSVKCYKSPLVFIKTDIKYLKRVINSIKNAIL